MMVSALKWVITYESGKGPMWRLGLRYQFSFGITSIVTKFESFLAARRAQSRACWILVHVCECA